ncbi:dynein axonemal light chain 4 isoform X1 [Cervus elaphus]|uniref:dynein axonemal light chain 4 isoform X1 n=1 Tax=Cervus elaphus TaxID=9860 RepID=UPI001CC27DDF|nr:dynein axonemal light chain 4 isoform X1 [Cervus elaphus]
MGETEGKKDEADYKRLQTFPLVRHSDMPEEMRVETMELCVTACEKFSNNNESAAKMIKETMDKKFGSSWHVVIGEGFGFEITHEKPLSPPGPGLNKPPRHVGPTAPRPPGFGMRTKQPVPAPAPSRPSPHLASTCAVGNQWLRVREPRLRGFWKCH